MGFFLLLSSIQRLGACVPVECDLVSVSVCKTKSHLHTAFLLAQKVSTFDMDKIQISSLGSKSYILCRLTAGWWQEKLGWDMQKWRARLCLTFRLNYEPDTTDSSCCILLFAKLPEIVSNSEVVSNKIFFLDIVDPCACNCKRLLLFHV